LPPILECVLYTKQEERTMIIRRTAQGTIGGLVTALIFVSVMSQAQSQTPKDKVLTRVADVPMPGPPVRFDYQSLDALNGRLYIAHMNADQLVVFDTGKRAVVANLDGFKRVHGVFAAPEAHRLFASATGIHQVIAVDTRTLRIVGAAGPITYPDGLAYVPKLKKVFASDEHGGLEAVIDATTMTLTTTIPLGGGAGNTVYDPISGHVLVAVHGVNMLVIIDPATNLILRRYPLPGIENPHGIVLDVADRVAFVTGEENHSLAVVDLNSRKMLSSYPVGADPDVLAFDPSLKRLYVAAESGTVTIFQYTSRKLELLGTLDMPHAHSVAVDPRTHLVYFPLQDVAGHPILRIMRPSDWN
jgi:DNA-binding beta-propeller fold protein YncE